MLYGDDDTVFFVDNALGMLEELDHNMPYFLTDHLWFPDQFGKKSYGISQQQALFSRTSHGCQTKLFRIILQCTIWCQSLVESMVALLVVNAYVSKVIWTEVSICCCMSQ